MGGDEHDVADRNVGALRDQRVGAGPGLELGDLVGGEHVVDEPVEPRELELRPRDLQRRVGDRHLAEAGVTQPRDGARHLGVRREPLHPAHDPLRVLAAQLPAHALGDHPQRRVLGGREVDVLPVITPTNDSWSIV